MQNETQNQNIDTQEVKVEEAAVQTEAPQEQNIGVNTDQYRGPDVEEPADITDPKVTMSSDDLVGSDPKVTMHPEDISGPGAAEGPGFDDGTSIEDISSEPLAGDLLGNEIGTENVDYIVETDFTSNGGDAGWDSGFYGRDEPGSDGSIWDFFSPDVPEDTTAGGYDGSGIAGGLDLDGNGKFDQTENNPDIMSNNGEEQVYTYDENAYEDAEDALEDLQDALQDGDEEDLAEALEELQDYLGGFGKGDQAEDQDGTKTQDDQIPSDTADNSDGGAGTM